MEHYQYQTAKYSMEYIACKRGQRYYNAYYGEEQIAFNVTKDRAIELCQVHYVEHLAPVSRRRPKSKKPICKKSAPHVEMNDYLDYINDMDDNMSMVEEYASLVSQNNFYED